MSDNPDTALADVVAEVRGWLQENWDPSLSRLEWLDRWSRAGWAAPSWEPQWFGRGLTSAQSRAVQAEFAKVGAPGIRPGPDEPVGRHRARRGIR